MTAETLCLVATIAGRAVAVPAACVCGVVDLETIVPVPRADPAVVGLAALRSRVVTVVDARPALGGAASGDGRRALLLSHDGHDYALQVDDCADIAPLSAEPLPNGLALNPQWRAAAQGLALHAGAPLLVIDPAVLLPRAA